jgi:hypothetical protein
VPVARIECLAGRDFGTLHAVDPLAGQEAGGVVIEGPGDIRLGR